MRTVDCEMTDYALLAAQVKALTEGEPDLIANLSNISALLNESMKRINWVGFYLVKGEELVLGPFQGKPACVRIPLSRGVCGAAASGAKSMLVDDVHQFEGHIACDADSQSELVVPIISQGRAVAVIDIDSPVVARFTEADREGIETVVREIVPLFGADN